MRTREQILARMAEVRADIETLAAVDGDLDEAQTGDWDSRNTEWDGLTAELATVETRNARLADMRSRNLTVETGDGAAAVGAARDAGFQQQRQAPDNIYDLDSIHLSRSSAAYGVQVRDRAMRNIETWDTSIDADCRTRAAALINHAADSQRDRDVAEHILRTGSPEYFRAFCKVLSNPILGLQTLEPEEARAMRAAMAEGATTTGGFAVPPFLDPTIILTNVGIANPFRSIATIKSITTQTWKGLTSAGVTAEWTAEAAEAADASPTFAQPTITPVRADAYVQASFEVIEDTSVANDLAMLFADARDRLEGTAFAVGTGTTQPTGIVTALALVTASKVVEATPGTFAVGDVMALDNAMGQRYRANASWVANKTVYNTARLFATGTGPMTGAFWVDLGGGHPAMMIGYSVYEASAMTNTITTATTNFPIILGDFRAGYYIIDRIGMSVAYNPLVIGANRRPTGEAGWFAFWRVGAGCVNPDAFRMLAG